MNPRGKGEARPLKVCGYSQSQMLLPGLLGIITPVVVGAAFGKYALSAMLPGVLSSSSILSTFFNFGGGYERTPRNDVERSS